MKVKLNRVYAGKLGTWQAGKIADLPEDQAKAWVNFGYAEYLEEEKKPEQVEEVTVAQVDEETTEKPGPKPKAKPKKGKRGRPAKK